MSRRPAFGFQVRDVRTNNEVAFVASKKTAIAKADMLAALNFHVNARYTVRDTRTGITVHDTAAKDSK
jgi:hypothetical protein